MSWYVELKQNPERFILYNTINNDKIARSVYAESGKNNIVLRGESEDAVLMAIVNSLSDDSEVDKVQDISSAFKKRIIKTILDRKVSYH